MSKDSITGWFFWITFYFACESLYLPGIILLLFLFRVFEFFLKNAPPPLSLFEIMAGAEVDRDVERHPSWSDRSLPAPALTRQAAGGRNPGSGEGREGYPKFATNGTRSGVSTGGVGELDRGDFGGYSRRGGRGECPGGGTMSGASWRQKEAELSELEHRLRKLREEERELMEEEVELDEVDPGDWYGEDGPEGVYSAKGVSRSPVRERGFADSCPRKGLRGVQFAKGVSRSPVRERGFAESSPRKGYRGAAL